MERPKSIRSKNSQTKRASAHPTALEPVRDTPNFLIRLVGARQAKTLAARTGIRHRHD